MARDPTGDLPAVDADADTGVVARTGTITTGQPRPWSDGQEVDHGPPSPPLARLALTIAALLLVAGCTSADDDVAPDNADDAAAATSTAAATEELATVMAGVLGPEADVSGAVGAIVPFPPVLTPPLADVVGFSASVDGPVDGPADEGGGTRAVTSVCYDVEVGAANSSPTWSTPWPPTAGRPRTWTPTATADPPTATTPSITVTGPTGAPSGWSSTPSPSTRH